MRPLHHLSFSSLRIGYGVCWVWSPLLFAGRSRSPLRSPALRVLAPVLHRFLGRCRAGGCCSLLGCPPLVRLPVRTAPFATVSSRPCCPALGLFVTPGQSFTVLRGFGLRGSCPPPNYIYTNMFLRAQCMSFRCAPPRSPELGRAQGRPEYCSPFSFVFSSPAVRLGAAARDSPLLPPSSCVPPYRR